MPRWLPALGCICALVVAADLPSETMALLRARSRMAENLDHLPNYTCLQTIERFHRPSAKAKLRLLDLVRMEVALVSGKELFAWPGSTHFLDTDITELVAGGAIGNGSFAIHAKSIFQSGTARFSYVGEVVDDAGRKALKWDFSVDRSLSGYTITVSARSAIVGYRGSIWVDPSTLDLLRIEVRAENIPAELGLQAASDAVEYTRVPIGGKSFLLPSTAELRMIAQNGFENVNRSRFERCRQYSGESVLIFEDPAPEEKPKSITRTLDAPPGIAFTTLLETPIRMGETAVGDPVTFRLRGKMKLGSGLEAPKGALLHGRLTLLREQGFVRSAGWAVGVALNALEFENTRVRLNAQLEIVSTAAGRVFMPGSSGTPSQIPHRLSENETVFGSVFFVQASALRLDRGVQFAWRTTAIEGKQ